MKQADVKVGKVYLYNHRGTLIPVRITLQFNKAYRGTILRTGKNAYISSARKLRPLDK